MTPVQHLDSTWSSPLNMTSGSATTSATTSGQTSYIFNLPLLALCADQAQQSSGSATTFLTWKLPHQIFPIPPVEVNQHPVAEVMHVLLKSGQSASREEAVEETEECRSMKQHWVSVDSDARIWAEHIL
ncbi:hypothetical protein F2Q69_00047510 [Brassica cretica]|uniref:Uncharacterized protein n=1 Tax=Brassica cretica TaxID=69181 RepID=A0A8S9PNX7_BRACR|nr:hypothetical protein F2Q69_00047510 [Brassica cretica]